VCLRPSASRRIRIRKSTAIGGTVADSIRILAADGFVPRRLPQRRGRRPIETLAIAFIGARPWSRVLTTNAMAFGRFKELFGKGSLSDFFFSA